MDHLATVFEQLRARRPSDPIVISARMRISVDDVAALAAMAETALMRSRGVPGAPVGLLARLRGEGLRAVALPPPDESASLD